MDFLNKNAGAVALIAMVIAIGGYFYPQISGSIKVGTVSGETNYSSVGAAGLKLGPNCGDSFSSSGCQKIAQEKFFGPVTAAASCQLITVGATVAASSTAAFDCPVTGVLSGDAVFAEQSTTTPSGTAQTWQVLGASASTTAGFVTLTVYNPTSVAATVPLYIASSTQLLILR